MTCIAPECQRPVHIVKKGLCRSHYQQDHRGENFTVLPKLEIVECAVAQCTRAACSKGLCSTHVSISSRFKLETLDIVRCLDNQWCYGCQQDIPNNKRVNFDHDHSCCPTNNTCGKCLRGTLCTSCNLLLGVYRDKPPRGSNLDAYVRNPPQLRTVTWNPTYVKKGLVPVNPNER